MESMDRPTCKTCVYFYKDNNQCRRHSPMNAPNYSLSIPMPTGNGTLEKIEDFLSNIGSARLESSSGYVSLGWPYTSESGWCGDHSNIFEHLDDQQKLSRMSELLHMGEINGRQNQD